MKILNIFYRGGVKLYGIYLTLTNKDINTLLYMRSKSIADDVKCRMLDRLIFHHADIDRRVVIGKNVNFVHNGLGVVIHPYTTIGNNVKIYQQVTIGRGDIWKNESSDFIGFSIEDDVVVCAGAKIICSHGKLTVRKGSIIGANSVLTQSTGEYEIWAGIPSRKIGIRNEK